MFELENRFAVKLHCRGEQYKTGILLVRGFFSYLIWNLRVWWLND